MKRLHLSLELADICIPWQSLAILAILALVSASLVFYTYGRKYLRMLQQSVKIPGPEPWKMMKLGLLSTFAEPFEIYKTGLKMKGAYDGVFKMWIGPKLCVFLQDPADVEIILKSKVHIHKSSEYWFMKPLFGNGLLISPGQIWKHHRKMITPTFHQSIIKKFVPKFYENSLKVCEKMKSEMGKSFDCHIQIGGTTVDILLETIMGYSEPRSEEIVLNCSQAVKKLCDIFHRRNYKLWLHPDYLFQKTNMAVEQTKYVNVISELSAKAIHNKKKEVLKTEEEKVQLKSKHEAKSESISGANLDDNGENDLGGKKRLPFLEQLTINERREDVDFTEQDVLDHVNTIIFEGNNTTTSCSSFVLCLMGIHKDIQEKVIQEVDDIFQKSNRECLFADTLEMKYLQRVIMETLRMYPTVPIIAREIKEEVKLASGDYTMPVGATVVIAPVVLHRRADTFPNPDVFNPDNFLPEKCQEHHFYSYIPFSAGPRSCVGRKFAMLMMKVLLSTIFRKYRVHCDLSEKDFKLQADITLKITDGFIIRLEPRKDTFIS